jgi:hypothetical protein
MTAIRVYANRHIKNIVTEVKYGDYIYLENNLSRKRWAIYFRHNKINESELNLTYVTHEEFFKLVNKHFDIATVNPPYSDGRMLLYPKFFKKCLEIADTVLIVMPDGADSISTKLKSHTALIERHKLCEPVDVTEEFGNVGISKISYFSASNSVDNPVPVEVHWTENYW